MLPLALWALIRVSSLPLPWQGGGTFCFWVKAKRFISLWEVEFQQGPGALQCCRDRRRMAAQSPRGITATCHSRPSSGQGCGWGFHTDFTLMGDRPWAKAVRSLLARAMGTQEQTAEPWVILPPQPSSAAASFKARLVSLSQYNSTKPGGWMPAAVMSSCIGQQRTAGAFLFKLNLSE